MKTKHGRLNGAARRLKQTPVSQWPRLFERWIPFLPDPKKEERHRIFPVHTTFWLFFSPGALSGHPLPRNCTQSPGLALGSKTKDRFA